MLYLSTILISMALIVFFNSFFYAPMWHLILATVCFTLIVIAIDGLIAFIVRWLLPQRWFSHEKTFFIVRKKEKVFYEKIKIKKWKDLVPEWGSLTGFRKNKIREPNNNDYVIRYIVEANYGLTLHFFSIFAGIALLFIYPPFDLNVALPVAIVNAILNFMPFAILRYNLSKLHVLYKFNLKKH